METKSKATEPGVERGADATSRDARAPDAGPQPGAEPSPTDAPRREVKARLRAARRAARQALSASERAAQAAAVATHLRAFGPLREAGVVGAYRALPEELSIDWLFAWPNPLQTLVFPRCNGEALGFCPASAAGAFAPGAFGVLEPVGAPIDATRIGWLLMPALACDARGARLGYGGGYYDRFLAAHPGLVPRTIAVVDAGGWMGAAPLPVEPWDIHVAYVAAPQGLVRVTSDAPPPSNDDTSGDAAP